MDLARPDKVKPYGADSGESRRGGALLKSSEEGASPPPPARRSYVLLFPPEVGVVFSCDSTVSFTTAPTRRVLSACTWLLFTPFVQ